MDEPQPHLRRAVLQPLKKINDGNVDKLGLAFYVDLPTNQNVETTPLMVDGVLYITLPWSMVMAVDAKTGKQLWLHDPKVAKAWNINICCGVDNRGAAAWNGKIIFGTLDGRLIALNSKTGKEVWSTKATPNEKRYSITGAPRVANGMVFIARPVPSSTCAVTSMPSMPRPASTCGASGPCRAIPQPASRTRPWKWPQPHGKRRAGGRAVAAARCGMPSLTTRRLTS